MILDKNNFYSIINIDEIVKNTITQLSSRYFNEKVRNFTQYIYIYI